MCGIAGIIGNVPNRLQCVERMTAALKHRGPDGLRSMDLDNKASFGHARLAIIDLEGGGQPMKSADDKRAIVFNGEIYGYRDIRKQLDYPYRTKSDTEVILALRDKYSDQMMERLPGMFAFAIWDSHTSELFCARDRFGEKPFYYAFGEGNSFVFASEIKAVIASGLVKQELNYDSLLHYLKFGYVPPELSIWKNIHSLPPAHTLKYSQGYISVARYWQLPEIKSNIRFDDAVDEFRFHLERAISSQMVCDVPISGFLSAGTDSTTIMMLASQMSKDIKAFSFDFGDNGSEAMEARRSAELYGLDFEQVRIPDLSLLETIKEVLKVYDEPFADSSAIPTFLICKEASKRTKVALTGDGGDEMLAGYDFFYRPLLDFKLAQFLAKAKDQTFLLAKILWRIGMRRKAARLFDVSRTADIYANSKTEAAALANSRAVFCDRVANRLLGVSDNSQIKKLDFTISGMSGAFAYDIQSYLPGDILVKTDRASMAHGIELRAPFLDANLTTFLLSMPSEFKISRNTGKILLREAFQKKWSEGVRNMAKKGFEAPIQKWMNTPEISQYISDTLWNPRAPIFSLVSFEETQRNLAENGLKKWALLCLSLWADDAARFNL